MITDQWRRKQQALQQEAARDRMASMDQEVGVGPWGQSMSPYLQPERDNLMLQANDPQAFNRKFVTSQRNLLASQRPNPFEMLGNPASGIGVIPGPGMFGNGRSKPFTQISTPGGPAGSPSFTQTPSGNRSRSKFPNPFS